MVEGVPNVTHALNRAMHALAGANGKLVVIRWFAAPAPHAAYIRIDKGFARFMPTSRTQTDALRSASVWA